MKLNRTSLGETAPGQLVNLMSNDVQRFDFASTFLHYIWIMPITTAIATYVMYRNVSWAALAGLIAITLQAVPLQGNFHKHIRIVASIFLFKRLFVQITG